MISEDDEWSANGPNVLATDFLAKVKSTLEDSAVIVEHWFYRGARAPSRLIFDDYEEFVSYINTNSNAGDAFYLWNFSELCRDDNQLTMGKFPDAVGRTPRRGAY